MFTDKLRRDMLLTGDRTLINAGRAEMNLVFQCPCITGFFIHCQIAICWITVAALDCKLVILDFIYAPLLP